MLATTSAQITAVQAKQLLASHSQSCGCLLCRGEKPANWLMNFIPSSMAAPAFKVPLGRIRVFQYGLCDSCRSRPDYPARVEARFLADLSAGGVQ